LGGRDLWEAHAIETADALNQINPHFIRLRQLAVPPGAPLGEQLEAGDFKKSTDIEVARELLRFIEKLNGITSVIKSDHVLNLFMDLQGTLPDDKERMTAMLRGFLHMSPDDQRLYQLGRRLGFFARTRDMQNTQKKQAAETAYKELGVMPDNIDAITDELMTRFI
jgi:hypothetical protein